MNGQDSIFKTVVNSSLEEFLDEMLPDTKEFVIMRRRDFDRLRAPKREVIEAIPFWFKPVTGEDNG